MLNVHTHYVGTIFELIQRRTGQSLLDYFQTVWLTLRTNATHDTLLKLLFNDYHKYYGPTSLPSLHIVSLCFFNLEFATTKVYMTLGTHLWKLLFNKQSPIQRVGVAFMCTQRVAFHSIWNWRIQISINPISILQAVWSTKTINPY